MYFVLASWKEDILCIGFLKRRYTLYWLLGKKIYFLLASSNKVYFLWASFKHYIYLILSASSSAFHFAQNLHNTSYMAGQTLHSNKDSFVPAIGFSDKIYFVFVS